MNAKTVLLSKLTPLWLLLTLLATTLLISSPVLSNKDAVFSFNDGAIEANLNEGSRPPGIFFRQWNNQFFLGLGLRNASPNTVQLMEWGFGAHQRRRYGVLISIIAAGLAAYAACRLFNRSKPASFIAAIIASLCGWTITFPMSGLTTRSWLLSWVLLSVGLIHYGQRKEKLLPYMLAGGFLGMAITDSPDVGVLGAVCCALYFLVSHFSSKKSFQKPAILKTAVRFFIYAAFSALMANQTVLNMFELYVKKPSSEPATETAAAPEQKTYEWATQWSLPANETWSLFASDYHGASSRSQKYPYWGRMGRTDGWEKHKQGFRNFRLSGYALGTVPFILLLFGWLLIKDRKKEDRFQFYVLNGLLLLTLFLSWGKYFPLYRIVYELPILGSIRNPEKWMCGFFTFIIIAIAYSFDFILARFNRSEKDAQPAKASAFWITASILPVLLLFNLFSLLKKTAFIQHLKSEGFDASTSDAIFNNALSVVTISLVCALIAGTAISLLLIQKKKSWAPFLIGILVILPIIELSKAAKPYVIPHSYRHILENNDVINLLKADFPNNRIKVIPPQDPILNNFRLTWLRAQNFSLFDPVSVRDMPSDYTLLFEQLQNDPLTLWKVGAIRYFVCSPQVAQQLLGSGQFTQRTLFTFTQSSDGALRPKIIQRPPSNNIYYAILEYNNALPYIRFSRLFESVQPGAEGHKKALTSLKKPKATWTDYIESNDSRSAQMPDGFKGQIAVLNKIPAKLELKTESSEDSFLIVAEKYDPHWVAKIDGDKTPIYRADGILQGIWVPKGSHSITLRYEPPKFTLAVSGAGFVTQAILVLLFAISLLKRREKISDH